MTNATRIVAAVSAFLLLASCHKGSDAPSDPNKSTDFAQFSISSYSPQVTIDAPNHRVAVQMPATTVSGSGLVPQFELTKPGATARISGAVQVSGVTPVNFDNDVQYQLVNEGSTTNWTVSVTNNNYTYEWNLGHFIKSTHSTARSYEWYYDQGVTGVYAAVNCGPSSATMAIKWADELYAHPPEYGRTLYGTSGGWWFTNDMISFIGTDNNIPLAVLPLGTSAQSTWEKITHQLDLNRVVILCLDANYISGGPNAAGRLDKFYTTTPGFGHFIVVKGYAEVDNNKLYEVYDPYSFGKQNADGTLMGRGRYYRFTDIFNATRVWWNFAMAINPKGQPIDPGTLRTAVDPATVPNSYGY